MRFQELSKQEYEEFQSTHQYCNFLNSIEMLALEEKEGYKTYIVGIKDKEEIVCATTLVQLPMMKKFHYFYAPRGILIDYTNTELLSFFMKEVKAYAKSKGAIYVVMDPYALYKERDIDGNLVEGGFDYSYIIHNLQQAGANHTGLSVGYGKNMQYVRWMYSMYLDEYNEQSLWKALHQQTRWSINRTLKYSMQVRELQKEEMHIFDDILRKTGERRNFESRTLSFYQHQMEAYKDHLKVLLAYVDVDIYRSSLQDEYAKEEENQRQILAELEKVPNSKKFNKKLKVSKEAIEILNKKLQEADDLEKKYGTIIPMAASMFMLYGNEVTYLTSGAYEEFRNFYASYAIQWHMIKEALNKGYTRYNFYGISGEFDEDNENYGVYKFKRGFPGVVEELVGDFILVCRPVLYKTYKTLRDR